MRTRECVRFFPVQTLAARDYQNRLAERSPQAALSLLSEFALHSCSANISELLEALDDFRVLFGRKFHLAGFKQLIWIAASKRMSLSKFLRYGFEQNATVHITGNHLVQQIKKRRRDVIDLR